MRLLRFGTCVGAGAVAAIVALLAAGGAAAGTVTVTLASGGSAISADTAATGGTGAYTALTGPLLVEGAAGDIGTGTVVISAPPGFAFQPGQGTCAPTLGNGAVAYGGTTAATATCTVTAASTVAGRIAFSGLKVRPLQGTPLATGTLALGGTAVLAGTPATAGTLTEVAGLATRLKVTGQTSSGAGDSVPVTITAYDRFGSRATGYAGTKTLTFASGPGSTSFPGHPDVVNIPGIHAAPAGPAGGFGVPIAFGFTAGVSSRGSVLLYRAEVARLCVADGTIGSAGSDCLDITVSRGPISLFSATELVANGRGRFSMQPVLAQSDNYGNVLPSPSFVTAKFRPGNAAAAATGATLSGTTTVTTVAGYATFTDLGIDRAGAGFQLQFDVFGWCGLLYTDGPCHTQYSLPFSVPDLLATTTTLASSAPAAVAGTSVTLTATVAGVPGFPPSGGVTFRDGATVLGTGTLIGGSATLTTAALAAGTHALTASYTGDASYGAGTSSALTQVITAAPTPGTVTVTPATGAGAISADTAASGGNGAFTTLAGPVLVEQAAGNIAEGTVVLRAPAGFAFQPGSGACSVTQGNLVAALTSVTATAATCTVAAPSTVPARLAFSGLAVRPLAGSPLATGELTLAGTSAVATSSASLGALVEVPGQAARLSLIGDGTIQAGESLPFATVAYDAFGNVASGYQGTKLVTFDGAPAVTVPGHPGIGSSPLVRGPAQSSAAMGAPLALTFAAGQAGDTSALLVRVGVNHLCATAGALAAAGDDCLDGVVEPGPALVRVTVQPVATGRGTFAVQPQVVVADSYGNVLPGAAPVTVAIRADNAAAAVTGATLTGSTTAVAMDGIATFSGLGIDRSATGFQLDFTAVGTCGAGPASIGACAFGASGSFDVPGVGALALAGRTAPGTPVGGRYRQPVVGLLRDDGTPESTPAADATITVTVSPAAGAGAARTAAARSSGGVATFTGLTIDSSAAPVVVRAVDGAGHVAQAGSRAPLLTAAPPAVSPSQVASFAWTTIATTRSECALDGGSFAPCSSPRTFHGLAAGPHALCVRTVGEPGASCTSWTVTGPGAPVPSIIAISVSGRAATATFTAGQPGVRFTCSLDGAPYRSCSAPLVFNGLASGLHTLRVLAANFAGQVAAVPALASFTVG